MPPYKLRKLSPHSIELGERARKDLGDIDTLAESIKTQGLFQPISVSQGEDGTITLQAGGRRLAACKKAGVTEIPCIVFSGVDDLDNKMVELCENIHRKDMSWQEETSLIARIHKLQVEKFGKKARGPGGAGWGVKNTAEMVGINPSYASRCIELADALEEHPDNFEGASGVKDALNRLEDKKREVVEEELTKRVEQSLRDNPQQEEEDEEEEDGEELVELPGGSGKGSKKNRDGDKRRRLRKLTESYVLGDFFEKAKSLPDESFDVIECDPPYGTKFNEYRKSGGIFSYKSDESVNSKGDNYEEVGGEYGEFLGKLIPELYRLAKPHSWVLLWFDTHHWEKVRDALSEEGFVLAGQPGVWVKSYSPSVQPYRVLGNKYECFWYGRKGEAVLSRTDRGNIFYRENRGKRIHPAERPVELMSEILSTFCPPKGRVLCPFLGSGNTNEAAYDLGFTSVGFDKSEYYRNRHIARLTGDDKGDE